MYQIISEKKIMHCLPNTASEIIMDVCGKGNGPQGSTPCPEECVTPPKAGSGRVTSFQVSPEKTLPTRTLTCWAEVSGRDVLSYTTAG